MMSELFHHNYPVENIPPLDDLEQRAWGMAERKFIEIILLDPEEKKSALQQYHISAIESAKDVQNAKDKLYRLFLADLNRHQHIIDN